MFFEEKKSLYLGYSLEDYLKVVKILEEAKIPYKEKVKEMSGRGSGIFTPRADIMIGNAGINQAYTRMYEILVKKTDYDRASRLMIKKEV